MRSEQSEQRWTLYRHGDYAWHIAPDGPHEDWDERTTVVEVMPVAEAEKLMWDMHQRALHAEQRLRTLSHQAGDLVEAWEAGELNDAGSTFRKIKTLLAGESWT